MHSASYCHFNAFSWHMHAHGFMWKHLCWHSIQLIFSSRLKNFKQRCIHLFKRINIFKLGKGRKRNYSISPTFESAVVLHWSCKVNQSFLYLSCVSICSTRGKTQSSSTFTVERIRPRERNEKVWKVHRPFTRAREPCSFSLNRKQWEYRARKKRKWHWGKKFIHKCMVFICHIFQSHNQQATALIFFRKLENLYA